VLVAYETTSTALANFAHVLATHPDEQLKLQQHVDAHFESENRNNIPSYDTVSQMEYLHIFFRETLRVYTVAPLIINRQSTEEFHIKNIGTIPVDTRIAIDIHILYFDPDLWSPVHPHIFYPERFESKRHPMVWISFGTERRNCVGMCFALMEL